MTCTDQTVSREAEQLFRQEAQRDPSSHQSPCDNSVQTFAELSLPHQILRPHQSLPPLVSSPSRHPAHSTQGGEAGITQDYHGNNWSGVHKNIVFQPGDRGALFLREGKNAIQSWESSRHPPLPPPSPREVKVFQRLWWWAKTVVLYPRTRSNEAKKMKDGGERQPSYVLMNSILYEGRRRAVSKKTEPPLIAKCWLNTSQRWDYMMPAAEPWWDYI